MQILIISFDTAGTLSQTSILLVLGASSAETSTIPRGVLTTVGNYDIFKK